MQAASANVHGLFHGNSPCHFYGTSTEFATTNFHGSFHHFHGLDPMGEVESFNFRWDWNLPQTLPMEASVGASSVAASSSASPEAYKEMRSLPRASMTRPWVSLSSNYVHLIPKNVTYLHSFRWLLRASMCFPKYECMSSVFDDKRDLADVSFPRKETY